ncbi:major facilitator superfamily domain-containing protein [Thermothelomyces heterothallicus CBS 202.75]|uniref:major facilitator superfamily domain-containing protein n=1 Tax=Thermothelomyces heterothallicus CBS 202.75 TaxID=1149848 RepID=UPI003744358F
MAVVDETSVAQSRHSHDNEKSLDTTPNPPANRNDLESSNGHTKGDTAPDGKNAEPKRTITGLKWFIIFTSLMSTIGVSFVLGQVVILPIGKAFGMFNMKFLFVVSLILFEVGSAVCGAAPNMNAIILGRVIAGIGGAGVYVGGLTYISILTTPNERPLYFAICMSLPIAALFAPAFLFSLPNINAMPDIPFKEKMRKQDWVGIVIFTAFLACFSMAGSFGGTHYAWNSGSEIALWVMTLVLFIAFAFLVAGSMMMSIYYTPLIFQFTRGDTPLMAGVRILPLICMIVFGYLFNGVAMPKTGYYMPWFVVGNALLVAGSALMTTITPSISNSALYGYAALLGLGIGAFQSAGVGVASALAPPPEVSNVVSVMTVVQVLGIILTLSVSGSVFTNRAILRITSALPKIPRSEATALITGASGHFYENLDESDRVVVVREIMSAISEAFYYLVAITAIGFITSLFLSLACVIH